MKYRPSYAQDLFIHVSDSQSAELMRMRWALISANLTDNKMADTEHGSDVILVISGYFCDVWVLYPLIIIIQLKKTIAYMPTLLFSYHRLYIFNVILLLYWDCVYLVFLFKHFPWLKYAAKKSQVQKYVVLLFGRLNPATAKHCSTISIDSRY